jgi:hypothetical protein
MIGDTADERVRTVALARATAAVLSLGTWIALLAGAVSACALWRVASAGRARGGWLADLTLGAVALYFAVRVRLADGACVRAADTRRRSAPRFMKQPRGTTPWLSSA